MSTVPKNAINEISHVVTEADFQSTVIEAAELFGWWVFHDHDSRRNKAGLPDLLMVRGNELLFAELKREKGKPTKTQEEVIESLSNIETVESHIWRPSNWAEIMGRLR